MLKAIVRLAPRGLVRFKGHILGLLLYWIDGKHRRLALSNLKAAMGEKIAPELQTKIIKNSFAHFGKVFLDLMHLAGLKPEKQEAIISIEGEEHIQTALLKGKGALLFSGHFGLWEMAPAIISRWGKVHVVARPLDNRLLEKELLKIRAALKAHVIYKHRASRSIIRALRANEMVAILIDQNVLRSEAIFVEFFGKMAATTPSLAAFHLWTNSPLIPVFCFPEGKNKFRIRILKPISTPKAGQRKEKIIKITQQCTQIIEGQIRGKPELWFWFHDRWKTRP